MIGPKAQPLDGFSREAFETSGNPASLCTDLEAVLQPRLMAAQDRLAEAHRIVDDLRRAGHALCSWDESCESSIWGDDYVNPPSSTRFLVEMKWPSDCEPCQSAEVVVTFGLWPTRGDV
jgi:hypothetical protein